MATTSSINGGGGLILNGLKGADLIIYNLLYISQERISLTAGQISYLTRYHPNTVFSVLHRLEELGLIERIPSTRGQRCLYKINRGQL